jgi:hypothetical protein
LEPRPRLRLKIRRILIVLGLIGIVRRVAIQIDRSTAPAIPQENLPEAVIEDLSPRAGGSSLAEIQNLGQGVGAPLSPRSLDILQELNRLSQIRRETLCE